MAFIPQAWVRFLHLFQGLAQVLLFIPKTFLYIDKSQSLKYSDAYITTIIFLNTNYVLGPKVLYVKPK